MSVSGAGVFPLPPIPVQIGPLTAGQGASGTAMREALPDLASRPRRRIRLLRIYLPIAVQAFNANGANPAKQAFCQIGIQLRGALLWAAAPTIALTPGLVSLGSTLITEDFVNSIALNVEDTVDVTYAISLDQDIDGGGPTPSVLAIGFQLNGSRFIPAPGAIDYAMEV